METYEIMYDYTDEGGNESLNNTEEFTGTWDELQTYIGKMRAQGCYNIIAAVIREDYDE